MPLEGRHGEEERGKQSGEHSSESKLVEAGDGLLFFNDDGDNHEPGYGRSQFTHMRAYKTHPILCIE